MCVGAPIQVFDGTCTVFPVHGVLHALGTYRDIVAGGGWAGIQAGIDRQVRADDRDDVVQHSEHDHVTVRHTSVSMYSQDAYTRPRDLQLSAMMMTSL